MSKLENQKLDQILVIVSELQTKTSKLETNVSELQKDMTTVKNTMATKQDIADVLEIVTFIKDNAVERGEYMRDMIALKATVATKDYLDTKLASLRGDLVSFVHKKFATQ